MARRPGLKRIHLSKVNKILEKERTNQWDVYAPLSHVRLKIEDSLAPLIDRFVVCLQQNAQEQELKISETAMRQLCSILGIHPRYIEQLPASLVLNTIHCLLELKDISKERRFLLRLKGTGRPTLRAILPQNYVRFDDLQVLSEVQAVVDRENLRISNLKITDNIFWMRILLKEEVDLGSFQARDPAKLGFDVLSSETGCCDLQLRNVIFREICSNGLTQISASNKTLRANKNRMDRLVFQATIRSTLEETLDKTRNMAEMLGGTRSHFIKDVSEEIDWIFRKYRLGSMKGKVGRWVVSEVMKDVGLFGISQFNIIQAITAIARGLEPQERLRLEEAAGSYLLDRVNRN